MQSWFQFFPVQNYTSAYEYTHSLNSYLELVHDKSKLLNKCYTENTNSKDLGGLTSDLLVVEKSMMAIFTLIEKLPFCVSCWSTIMLIKLLSTCTSILPSIFIDKIHYSMIDVNINSEMISLLFSISHDGSSDHWRKFTIFSIFECFWMFEMIYW